MVIIIKLSLFLIVYVNVYIHFLIWTWIQIQNPRVTDSDLAKVLDPCGSGSTTLLYLTYIVKLTPAQPIVHEDTLTTCCWW
jgi:hypothetical protein